MTTRSTISSLRPASGSSSKGRYRDERLTHRLVTRTCSPITSNPISASSNVHDLHKGRIHANEEPVCRGITEFVHSSFGPAGAHLRRLRGTGPGQEAEHLVIFGDDIGIPQISAYTLGLMGYRTPNIDRIAREGAIFTDAYGQ